MKGQKKKVDYQMKDQWKCRANGRGQAFRKGPMREVDHGSIDEGPIRGESQWGKGDQ